MRTDSSQFFGFEPPLAARAGKCPRLPCAELFLTLALALSTAIALTAVSIGIARADALGSMLPDDGGAWDVALLLGSVLVVMGALTAAVTRLFEPARR